MVERFEAAFSRFREANPQARLWSDEKILEGLFLVAARQEGSGITIMGRDSNGKLQVRIKLGRTPRTG